MLTVPIELRNLILVQVLCEPRVINCCVGPGWTPFEEFQQRNRKYIQTTIGEYETGEPLHRHRWTPWGHGRPDLAVLVTCRQLYAEGTRLLFQHCTFVVSGFVDGQLYDIDSGSDAYLGSMPIRKALDTCRLLARIRKLEIRIHVSELNLRYGAFFSNMTHKPFWSIPWHLARHCGRFDSIKIVIDAPSEFYDHDFADLRARLYKFAYLRADSITLDGTGDDILDALVDIMSSHRPLIDLSHHLFEINGLVKEAQRINHSLSAKTARSLSLRFASDYELDALAGAALEWDVQSFEEIENQLMTDTITRLDAAISSLMNTDLKAQAQAQTLRNDAERLRQQHRNHFGHYWPTAVVLLTDWDCVANDEPHEILKGNAECSRWSRSSKRLEVFFSMIHDEQFRSLLQIPHG